MNWAGVYRAGRGRPTGRWSMRYDKPRLLVLDEAQRLAGPALEFLRGLSDHPDTDSALVFAGAGSERALRVTEGPPTISMFSAAACTRSCRAIPLCVSCPAAG